MNDEELNNVLQQLWVNWMFRLSLSSNELFHSNTLQYLAQCADGGGIALDETLSRDAVVRFLALLTNDQALTEQVTMRMGDGPFRVLRESKNTDIKIVRQDNNPLFVVEIKIKSYPLVEQLIRYGNGAANEWQENFSPPVFLLSLAGGQAACAAACGQAPTLNFHPVSFGELADRLAQLDFAQHPVVIRNEYVDLCRLLQNLAEKFNDRITTELTLGGVAEIADALRPFRLDSIWNKLWISFLKGQLRQELPQEVHVDSNFTNNALVEGYWRANAIHNPADILKVGVQLEGNSLRLFMNIDRPNCDRRAAERVLLIACANYGLFRNNPRYSDYAAYWTRNENFWNSDINMPAAQEQGNGQGPSWPRNTPTGRPRLHGYNPGFADFRIPLNPNESLQSIINLFRTILVQNNYSMPHPLGNDESILNDLCTLYENNPNALIGD